MFIASRANFRFASVTLATTCRMRSVSERCLFEIFSRLIVIFLQFGSFLYADLCAADL